jgi:hypothetical protein
MKLGKKLIVCSLLGTGLLACSTEPGELSSSDDKRDSPTAPGTLHFDIEVVGEGEVAILEPYVDTCTTEDGVCSFVIDKGARLRLEGDFVFASDARPTPCVERNCALNIEQNATIVVEFADSDTPRSRFDHLWPRGFLPGEPWIIIDPIRPTHDPRSKAPNESQRILVD